MGDLSDGLNIADRIHAIHEHLARHEDRLCKLEESHAGTTEIPVVTPVIETVESVIDDAVDKAEEAAEEAKEAAEDAEKSAEEAEQHEESHEGAEEEGGEVSEESPSEPSAEELKTPEELIEETPPDRHHPLNKRFSITGS